MNVQHELAYALSLLLSVAVTLPILALAAPRFGVPTWGANPAWYASVVLVGVCLCYLSRVVKSLVQKRRS